MTEKDIRAVIADCESRLNCSEQWLEHNAARKRLSLALLALDGLRLRVALEKGPVWAHEEVVWNLQNGPESLMCITETILFRGDKTVENARPRIALYAIPENL